jgi:D-sedoheptulose 7-phosphate isomerase
MNELQGMYLRSKSGAEYAKSYTLYLSKLMSELDFDAVSQIIELLLNTREKRKTVYFVGNGGSAATASHFANDLAIGTRCPSLPFKVMSLTDNVPVLTAIGNDFGYDQIFVKQLEVFMERGDVLVAISASGNSPNVVKAVEYANSMDNITVGLTGFDGGKLKQICRYGIHVNSNKGEYGPVEDLHMFLDHLIMTYLSERIVEQK